MVGIGNSNNVIVQQQQPKVGVGKKIGAAVAGLGIYGAAQTAVQGVTSGVLLPTMNKVGQSLTDAEFAQIKDATSKIIDKANLASKGVEIMTVNSQNQAEATEAIAKGLKDKLKRFLPKEYVGNVADTYASVYSDTVRKGKNAFFESAGNKIYVGESKDLATSVFHETGHAMNYNISKFGKILQKCRGAQLLALPIALIAILHKDKVNENGEQGKVNKAGAFIKQHAAGLTLLSFLPTVAEEGLASIKGAKLAKQLLDPALVKKVNKTNLCGFASYALMALASAAGIKLAVTVADKIRTPKNKEVQEA